MNSIIWIVHHAKAAIVLSMVCICSFSNAQVNFLGGNNDGFAKASYSEPDPSYDIFSGGNNDGFAKSSYAEPDPANDIFDGGINDGFARAYYSEADLTADIYFGGVNDGFAFSSYSEPDPLSDIYSGGANDGFALAFFFEELALPVEWKYFTVTKKNSLPFLEWSADREENCLSYEVLRSHDGKDFQIVETILCQGNSGDNTYEFEDFSPLWHRIYYYKIAQYDLDGKSTSSPVRAFIPAEPSQPEVYYRNGQVIVKTERETNLRSVSVYDFTGRTLCRQMANREGESYYRVDCQLNQNQLVIIQMVFSSFTSIVHMRLGN